MLGSVKLSSVKVGAVNSSLVKLDWSMFSTVNLGSV